MIKHMAVYLVGLGLLLAAFWPATAAGAAAADPAKTAAVFRDWAKICGFESRSWDEDARTADAENF